MRSQINVWCELSYLDIITHTTKYDITYMIRYNLIYVIVIYMVKHESTYMTKYDTIELWPTHYDQTQFNILVKNDMVR